MPYESYPCALLHFTGSDTFNTKIRGHAAERGYRLNEYALRKLDPQSGGVLREVETRLELEMPTPPLPNRCQPRLFQMDANPGPCKL